MTTTMDPLHPTTDHPFELKMYLKAELALLYCPHHSPTRALQNFYRWMTGCRPLMAELQAVGYNCHRHYFFKREVEIIRNHLGEP